MTEEGGGGYDVVPGDRVARVVVMMRWVESRACVWAVTEWELYQWLLVQRKLPSVCGGGGGGLVGDQSLVEQWCSHHHHQNIIHANLYPSSGERQRAGHLFGPLLMWSPNPRFCMAAF